MERITGPVSGFGLYVVSVKHADGTKDQHRDTSKTEAIASARTWSAKNGISSADVYKTDGKRVITEHVGHYEDNRHLRAVA